MIRKPLEPPKSGSTRKPSSTEGKKEPSPAEQIKKLWENVQKGESPIFVNVNNEAAVAYLLQFVARKEKLKLVLVATGPNLYQSMEQIGDNKNVTVVLQAGNRSRAFFGRSDECIPDAGKA